MKVQKIRAAIKQHSKTRSDTKGFLPLKHFYGPPSPVTALSESETSVKNGAVLESVENGHHSSLRLLTDASGLNVEFPISASAPEEPQASVLSNSTSHSALPVTIGVKRPNELSAMQPVTSNRPLKKLKAISSQPSGVYRQKRVVRGQKRIEPTRRLTDDDILAKSDAIQVSLWTHLLVHIGHNKEILRAFMSCIEAQGLDLKVNSRSRFLGAQEALDLVQMVS